MAGIYGETHPLGTVTVDAALDSQLLDVEGLLHEKRQWCDGGKEVGNVKGGGERGEVGEWERERERENSLQRAMKQNLKCSHEFL